MIVQRPHQAQMVAILSRLFKLGLEGRGHTQVEKYFCPGEITTNLSLAKLDNYFLI